MNKAYLLIGGNIGDRFWYLEQARKNIEKQCGAILKTSSIYETAAWGVEDQSAFLNQALKTETPFSAKQLLDVILKIEEELGRKRDYKYGPRTIDIDILLYNDEVIEEPELVVPHPHMQHRRFALVSLNDIASTIVHPALHRTIAQLLADCPDPLTVNKIYQ